MRPFRFYSQNSSQVMLGSCPHSSCSSPTVTVVDNYAAKYVNVEIGSDGLPIIGFADGTNLSAGPISTKFPSLGSRPRHFSSVYKLCPPPPVQSVSNDVSASLATASDPPQPTWVLPKPTWVLCFSAKLKQAVQSACRNHNQPAEQLNRNAPALPLPPVCGACVAPRYLHGAGKTTPIWFGRFARQVCLPLHRHDLRRNTKPHPRVA
jgi:hypothetical protein